MAAARACSDIWRGSLFSRGFIYNQGLKPCTRGHWGTARAAASGWGLGGQQLGPGLTVQSSGLESCAGRWAVKDVAGCGPGEFSGTPELPPD